MPLIPEIGSGPLIVCSQDGPLYVVITITDASCHWRCHCAQQVCKNPSLLLSVFMTPPVTEGVCALQVIMEWLGCQSEVICFPSSWKLREWQSLPACCLSPFNLEVKFSPKPQRMHQTDNLTLIYPHYPFLVLVTHQTIKDGYKYSLFVVFPSLGKLSYEKDVCTLFLAAISNQSPFSESLTLHYSQKKLTSSKTSIWHFPIFTKFLFMRSNILPGVAIITCTERKSYFILTLILGWTIRMST